MPNQETNFFRVRIKNALQAAVRFAIVRLLRETVRQKADTLLAAHEARKRWSSCHNSISLPLTNKTLCSVVCQTKKSSKKKGLREQVKVN
jgi:hypothetical protein